MRIIGGKFGGRFLKPPLTSWPTRPTTDIAREALYNILSNRINFEQSSFLDLFGGTGAHSLEFLSRGSKNVTYVDHYGKCISWIKKQIAAFELDNYCKVIRMDVMKYIKSTDQTFEVIFADPPYNLPWLRTLPDLILSNGLLNPDGLLIIEHGSDVNFESHSRLKEVRKYGQSRFSFFQ